MLIESLLRRPFRRLAQVIQDPRRVSDWVALQQDFATFKRRYGFLAEAKQYEDAGNRIVLIVSLTNGVWQLKAEAVLASALRLRGWRPVVLTFSHATVGRSYFNACGIDRFVYLDKMLNDPRGARHAAAQLAEECVRPGVPFQTLLGFRYRDVDLGRHVLSSVARSLWTGRIDLQDPHVVKRVKQTIVQSVEAIWAGERVFDAVRPQLTLFLERGYTPYGELFDLAVTRGTETIQWGHSHRSEALILKRYTIDNRYLHPFSLSQASWEAVKSMAWSAVHDRELLEELRGGYEAGTWFRRKFLHMKRLKSDAEVRQELGLDRARKTAVIFSHVLWDATFFYGDNLFQDYEEWLVETVRAACTNDAVNWVIKLHPDYVWKLKQLGKHEIRDLTALHAAIPSLPAHVKLLAPDTPLSTFSLFGVTDYCLTVRGTVGIEMACFGIPVLTAGTGRYAGLGFTVDSTTREEYLRKVRSIHEIPPLTAEQVDLAKKHAYGLLRLRPLPFRTFEVVQMPLGQLGHLLDHNVVIRPRSLQEFSCAGDLSAFASWAEPGGQEDYLGAPTTEALPVAVGS